MPLLGFGCYKVGVRGLEITHSFQAHNMERCRAFPSFVWSNSGFYSFLNLRIFVDKIHVLFVPWTETRWFRADGCRMIHCKIINMYYIYNQECITAYIRSWVNGTHQTGVGPRLQRQTMGPKKIFKSQTIYLIFTIRYFYCCTVVLLYL